MRDPKPIASLLQQEGRENQFTHSSMQDQVPGDMLGLGQEIICTIAELWAREVLGLCSG